ncbi:SMI1/KNR4 family protein [Metabacillus dongyingensis]|uniref:SMI1/KNR4 family protein n=1 Tax=Metabacillus dongyingensis TaxID=2874282 RepID=UPI003B8E3F77
MSHFVQNTLTGLKELLDDKGQLKVSYEEHVYDVACSFNSPTNLNEVDIFEKENNIKLPEDYKAFLAFHNEARLWFPIAHLLEDCYLYLDKLKEGNPNYLNILKFVDFSPLNLNFETFIDRYIISKGEVFWS